MLKSLIKSFLPKPLLGFYHKTLAILANIFYGFPSRKMVVIGVTGTKGKSSTTVMITRILEEAGFKVGSTNTIFFKIADKEWPNTTKQGMLGRFKLQRLLRQMVRAGCTHAVIEVTSEGISQSRQWGMAFDVAVFTNLSPEHIEAHGSYEKYREAKAEIFKNLHKSPRKTPSLVSPLVKGETVKKVIVANQSDKEAEYFLQFAADEKYAVKDEGEPINLQLAGEFMRVNALMALAAGQALGVETTVGIRALEKISEIPGRAQVIDTDKGFKVIVDYAHEPRSFAAILSTGRELAQGHKLIVVFGVTGGGRDKAKRPQMGEMASQYADYIILTTDDPYDDDPHALIAGIVPGIKGQNWAENKNWWRIVNRRDAIAQALALAHSGDVVLLLGKGSERVMAVAGGKTMPWNDGEVVREILGGNRFLVSDN